VSEAIAVGWDIHCKFSQWSAVQRNERGEIRVMKRLRLEHADRPAMRARLAGMPAHAPYEYYKYGSISRQTPSRRRCQSGRPSTSASVSSRLLARRAVTSVCSWLTKSRS